MSKINATLENLRISYQLKTLNDEEVKKNPFEFFGHWFDEALKSECDEPNAFVLSTITKSNKPRSRVVLLKGIEHSQFIFFTNYLSSKGCEIESNNNVCMNFLWLPLQRQVRIEGKVKKIEEFASDEYFKKRPRGSQLGALASPQSQKISSRKELERMFSIVDEKFKLQEEIKRPADWGGYSITPNYFEFWQGRPNRLHDRISYELKMDQWEISRLAP